MTSTLHVRHLRQIMTLNANMIGLRYDKIFIVRSIANLGVAEFTALCHEHEWIMEESQAKKWEIS